MKNTQTNRAIAFPQVVGSKSPGIWFRIAGLKLVLLALFAMGLAVPSARAQSFMTIKPFQIRIERPAGFNGTYILTNIPVRIPTNGATGLDITGTNWLIANVNVAVSSAPSGVTGTVTDSHGNPLGAIPINLNTGNTAFTTNVSVALAFNGSEPAGVNNVIITATGGGLPEDDMIVPVEVGKIWNGAALASVNGAGKWSDATKWLGGSPGANDNVVFTDVGAQTNNYIKTGTATNYLSNSVVDVSTTISSLRFSLTNGAGTITTNFQNLYIGDGITLQILGNDGFKTLRDYTAWNTKMMITIAGTNGTLIQSNENASFSLNFGDYKQQSVLDMSGLGNLYLDVNRLDIDSFQSYPNYTNLVYTNNYTGTGAGTGKPQGTYGTWFMAKTNFIKATYTDPYNYTNAASRSYALTVGRNDGSGGSSGQDCEFNMGLSNVFNLDSIVVAGPSSLGSDFHFQNTGSYAQFRNSDGVSRMSVFATSDDGGQTPLDKAKCGGNGTGVDFSKGYVDMLVDRLLLSQDATNNTTGNGYSQTSGFSLSTGVIDANTAILGYQSQGSVAALSTCFATMYVSNTAVFKVNTNLILGYTTGNIGDSVQYANASFGALNIGPGGTVQANNIQVGGPTKASVGNVINMNGNASLIVSNGIADSTPNGALGTLNLGGVGNNSLTLFIDGSKPHIPLVYVTNLTAAGVGNRINIGNVVNATYPVVVPLIGGVGPAISSSVFDAGVTMPAGSGLTGVLLDSTTNTINLEILNRTAAHLLWRAPAGGTGAANWDYTSKNWLDQVTGLMTNYQDPDVVAFDDTPGLATNITIGDVQPFIPSAVNMTNSANYYTFTTSGSGSQVLGNPIFNKTGTGTVEVDGNTSFTMKLNQGSLAGNSSGAIGGAVVAAGTTMNYAGAINGSVTCAGVGTSSGSIAGALTVQTGGVFTNSGSLANSFAVQTNAFLYNTSSGNMANIGVGSSGSPQVARGGILWNNGTIGAVGEGNILYVAGTFQDLAGGSDNITVQSVTVAANGQFIPGNGTTATTTINSDGTGSFPGAALLAQGATEYFTLNPGGSPLNTVLNIGHISFGGSSAQRSQNGTTLSFNNIGSPYAAGQRFTLFQAFGGNLNINFGTGTSTNTYPVISPAQPAPGLTWDFSQLWVNGSIGVVAATSGPVVTNNIAVDSGHPTNVITRLSWDASVLGYRLQVLNATNTIGLVATNWTGVSGSWTNTSVNITNTQVINNGVYYRLVFP